LDGTGFTIDGPNIPESDFSAGIRVVDGAENVTIQNVRIKEFAYGIALKHLGSTICRTHLSRNKLSGIFLSESSSNAIFANNMTQNGEGVSLYRSSSNVIFENNVTGGTWRGIYTEESNHNKFHSNNFLNNPHQVYDHSMLNPYYVQSINTWDDGYARGGNYWDDCNGTDSNHDGIGDTPHYLYANNTDRYPLTAPHDLSTQYYSFCAGTWNGTAFNVGVVSNTTLSDFTFSADQKLAGFNISGPHSTAGFCRIAIPDALLGGSYEVWAGTAPTNFSSATNGTHALLYFNYSHDIRTIKIVGATAIPEFRLSIVALLLTAVTLLAVMVNLRRFKLELV
jgi:parallel beta-helix repeat protein